MKTFILYYLLSTVPTFQGLNIEHAKEDKTDYNTYTLLFTGCELTNASKVDIIHILRTKKIEYSQK